MAVKAQQTKTRGKSTILSLFLLFIAGLTFLLVRLWQVGAKAVKPGSKLRLPVISDTTGLTEAEAAARFQPDQDNVLLSHPRRSRLEIIRTNTFTIFNLNLIALVFIQAYLGAWSGALITFGVMLLNIGLQIIQEEFARFQIRDLLAATRPQATVIRAGKVRSIDPGDIVIGDVLAVGPGDETMVDGRILGAGEISVEERLFTSEPTRVRKRKNELLFAGSICISGHATYEVTAIGKERQIVKNMGSMEEAPVKHTPIEKMLNRIMRILLFFVFFLGILFVMSYLAFDTFINTDLYVDAATVIFNIAPASLFFMVVLTYTAATADLGRIGALVYDSRSVESLAQVDTVCFAKDGILTGTTVEFTANEDTAVTSTPLAEARIKQILGNFAHSSPPNNPTIRALASSFSGERRPVVAEATFLSVYGWSALVFDEEDLRGVYVLAVPEILALDAEKEDEGDTAVATVGSTLSKGVDTLKRPFGRLFKRTKNDENHENKEEKQTPTTAPQTSEIETNTAVPETESNPESVDKKQSSIGGLFTRVHNSVSSGVSSVTNLLPTTKKGGSEGEDEEQQEEPDDSLTLVFAYTPVVTSIYTASGQPQLPTELDLLGQLTFQERVNPEAVSAIQEFGEREVDVKIFTPDAAQKTITMLTEAGLEQSETDPIHTISGPELATMPDEQWTQSAVDNQVFGQVTPHQTEKIVSTLQTAKYTVGVVADSPGDVNTLRQGAIAITRGSSSPAALSQADIVLLGSSPAVLSKVIDKGQRIVNGLLDVLKLYVTQAIYLILLLFGLPLLLDGFPYTSAEGGMVAVVTLTIPALGLSLWAPAGKLRAASLTRALISFVGPAATTMAIAGIIIYALARQAGGDNLYAQTVLTHMLVAMGLLLVFFIRPPILFSRRKKPTLGDWKVLLLVIFSAIFFLVATNIPFISDLIEVYPLPSLSAYNFIMLAALIWAVVLRILFFIIPIARPVVVSLETFQLAGDSQNNGA